MDITPLLRANNNLNKYSKREAIGEYMNLIPLHSEMHHAKKEIIPHSIAVNPLPTVVLAYLE